MFIFISQLNLGYYSFLTVFLISYITFFQNVSSIKESSKIRACADFNYAASQAALAGLYNVYVCPQDGISRVVCNETFPLKNVSSIVQTSVSWDDVLLYVLIGPGSRTDAFFWWIQFVLGDSMDLVIVADACPGNQTTCKDNVNDLQGKLNITHKLLRTHIVRANPSDKGYKILSCKLRTGMKKIYDQFPNRKYYFKIDTDTILFPRRFFSFLNTLEAVTESSKIPLYFGTIVESGMNLLLCGRNWENDGILLLLF